MNDNATFYQEGRDLGEVVSNGVRYRVFYDLKSHRTTCVLVAGQDLGIGPIMPYGPSPVRMIVDTAP